MTPPHAVRPIALVQHSEIVGKAHLLSVRSSDWNAYSETAILMVHGAFTGAWVYEKWLTYFAELGWRAHAISLRGHADSPAIDPAEFLEASVGSYVADVLAVAERLGDSVVLVGHSMGGLVVQKAVESRDFRALVLVASVGPAQLGRHDDDYLTTEFAQYEHEYRSHRALYKLDDESFEFIADHLQAESPTALNDCRGRTEIDRARVRCPVLVVGAECDETKVHPANQIAAFYGGDLLIVRDARHDLMLEPSALTTAAWIGQWLASKLHPAPLQSIRAQI